MTFYVYEGKGKAECQRCRRIYEGILHDRTDVIILVEQSTVNSGFTKTEKCCHDASMEALRVFNDLTREHPDELHDFTDAIHNIQGLLAIRIVRRCFPEFWPKK